MKISCRVVLYVHSFTKIIQLALHLMLLNFELLAKAEDGTRTEGRCRVMKAMKAALPSKLLKFFSFNSIGDISSESKTENKTEKSQGKSISQIEGDGGGIIDLIRNCMMLVPAARWYPLDLMSLPVFRVSPSSSVLVHDREVSSVDGLKCVMVL